jgi:aminodeoxyfutalosine deaminase
MSIIAGHIERTGGWMVALASDRDIETVPKVELHVHFGGSITEETAAALARRHGADPNEALSLKDGRYPGRYPEFRGFLDAYLAANQFIRTAEDLEFVAAEFARGQAAQNVIYSETIFTALIYTRNGMARDAMWGALRRGLAAGGSATRISIVVDAIRDFGKPEADATLALIKGADAPIVGLGLTGIEGTMPVADFVPYAEAAHWVGMGLEVHAGEMGPPSSIEESLDVLRADRIGHGVASIRDRALFDRLVREQIPLDVCPSSNVGIGEFPALEAHPMVEFWRAGMNFNISSDDPPFFGITLTEELRNVVRVLGLSRDDLAELERRGARAAFAPPQVKADLLAQIDAWAAAG